MKVVDLHRDRADLGRPGGARPRAARGDYRVDHLARPRAGRATSTTTARSTRPSSTRRRSATWRSSPSSWDRKRVEEREARNAAHRPARAVGRRGLRPTARLVALTEVMVNERITTRGFQSGTLVAREHRGHQLGLAIKLANHRQVRAAYPDAPAPAHRQRRRQRADERRQRRARLPRGRALRRDAEGRLNRSSAEPFSPAPPVTAAGPGRRATGCLLARPAGTPAARTPPRRRTALSS